MKSAIEVWCDVFPQDDMQVPVAIKTCKEDGEETMTEKFLEEACEWLTIVVFKSILYIF